MALFWCLLTLAELSGKGLLDMGDSLELRHNQSKKSLSMPPPTIKSEVGPDWVQG